MPDNWNPHESPASAKDAHERFPALSELSATL